MSNPLRRLCIFARSPRLGEVKRRLAEAVGDEAALVAHETLLRRTLDRCVGVDGYDTELWLTEVGRLEQHDFSRSRLALCEQTGGDLGARMNHALERGLRAGAWTVLIGCDCPDIDGRYVRRAFAELEHADVVVGPAEDGGYGLIGLRKPVPALFTGMPWGTAEVLQTTLVRAADAGVGVTLLEEIYDVDTEADWQRFQRSTDALLRGRETE